MRYLVAVLIAAWMWAAGPAPAALADGDWLAVVRVDPQPSVAGPDIVLGEIAVIEAPDPALRQQLASLPVGRAAMPGQGRELHVGTVRVRMRQAGLPERQIRIEAPAESLRVVTRAQTVDGSTLASVAQAAVWANLPRWQQEIGHGTLDVTCPVPSGLTLVDGALGFTVVRVSGTPPGPVVVSVSISVDGTAKRTVTVRCDTRWLAEVWVVQSPVLRHQVLDESAVALELREFSALPRGLVPAGEDPSGWRAVRPLPPGTILAAGAVERVPLVWKGRPVSMNAQAGAVWVNAPGVALEDGRLGEVVRVQSSLSGYVVQARVVGVDAVEVLVP